MRYDHDVHVAAPPDRVYPLLADTENLKQVVPQLIGLSHTDGDRVEVEARYEGHTQRGEAMLETDADARRVSWRVEQDGYHGSLLVQADGDGSRVHLELTTPSDRDLDAEVMGTLDSIRRLIERQV